VIVGDGVDRIAEPFRDPSVDRLGFVPDLGLIYARARVSLCPVRRGGGTRIKIIEAAMNARPVVSTHVGAEGLSFRPDHEILLADGAVGFAAACVRLLCDPALAAAIGGAAQRHARTQYAGERVAGRLVSVCARLLARGEASGSEPSASVNRMEIGAKTPRSIA
jgi:glycosyltransferase involved in cell wall biosynthesis